MPTRLHNKLNDFSYPVLELPLYIFILFAGRFFFFHEMGFAKLLYGFSMHFIRSEENVFLMLFFAYMQVCPQKRKISRGHTCYF